MSLGSSLKNMLTISHYHLPPPSQVFHLTPGDPKPTWKLSCNHKTTTETATQSCSCDHLNLYQKHSKGCNNNPKIMQKCCCHNNVLSSACIIHHSSSFIIHHHSSFIIKHLSSSVSIQCESWIAFIAYINHDQHQYQSPSVIITFLFDRINLVHSCTIPDTKNSYIFVPENWCWENKHPLFS